MKKLLALLLAAVMVLSLAACEGMTVPGASNAPAEESDKAPEGGEEAKEIHVVKVDMPSMNIIPSDENIAVVEEYINDYILNTLGIDDLQIDICIYSIAEYSTSCGLALAGGEDRDMIMSMSLNNYVANGYMVDITDYLQDELKGAAEVLGDWLINTKIGDKYYGLCAYKGLSLTYKFFYDKAYTDGVYDMDTVHDPESFADCLAALKEAWPEEHFLVYGSTLPAMFQAEDHTITVANGTATVGDDPTLVNYYKTAAYENSVRTAYDWNQKGYFDPEGTANSLGHDAVVLSGSSKGVLMGHAYSEETCAQMFDTNNTYGATYGANEIFQSDVATNALAYGISYTSKQPEATARMMNLIWTDEFIMSALIYGKEGVSWVWNEDHSSIVYPEGLGLDTVPYTCLYLCGAFGNQFNLYGMDGNTSEADKGYMKELLDTAFYSPLFGFVPDSTPVQTQVAAVTNVVNQYNDALTYGELEPDEYLPIFWDELETAGIEDIIVDYQAQADAWLASK